MSVTIEDVAKQASVSTATVSGSSITALGCLLKPGTGFETASRMNYTPRSYRRQQGQARQWVSSSVTGFPSR